MMQDKKIIFHDTVEEVEDILKVRAKRFKGILEFFEMEYKQLSISLQTDTDKHLETIIVLNGRSFSNGSDHVPRINDWRKWSKATVEGLKLIEEQKMIQEVEFTKNKKYVGGRLEVIRDLNVIDTYQSLQNNLLPIFKKRQTSVHRIV